MERLLRRSSNSLLRFDIVDQSVLRKAVQLIQKEEQLNFKESQSPFQKRVNLMVRQQFSQLMYDTKRLLKADNNSNRSKVEESLLKMGKIKQLYLYCPLARNSEQLEQQVIKFMGYLPKGTQSTTQQDSEPLPVESMVNSPILRYFSQAQISDLLHKECLRSFNTNSYFAELFDFMRCLDRNQMLKSVPKPKYKLSRNEDLVKLQSSNVVFHTLCQINDKYSKKLSQIQKGYIRLDCLHSRKDKLNQVPVCNSHGKFLQDKLSRLKRLCQKIKKIGQGVEIEVPKLDGATDTMLLSESKEVFQLFGHKLTDVTQVNTNTEYLSFLAKLLTRSSVQQEQSTGSFAVLRAKIIKTQTLSRLSRILSAFNMASYVANSFDGTLRPTQLNYSFTDIHNLIKNEFNPQRGQFYTSTAGVGCDGEKNIAIDSDSNGYLLHQGHHLVVYPSAIKQLFCFLQSLLSLSSILQSHGLFNEELLLEVLSIKMLEIEQWGNTVYHLYTVCRNKYIDCYGTIVQFIRLIFGGEVTGFCDANELIKSNKGQEGIVDQLLQLLLCKQQRANSFGQIIFQLDSSYSLSPALSCLLQFQLSHSNTRYHNCSPVLYSAILHEMIEIRNNLKHSRTLSFSMLHSMFGYFTHKSKDFACILQELALSCTSRIKLPELFRFLACQHRIKKLVFVADLHWSLLSGTKGDQSTRSTDFWLFINQNCKYLLSMADKSLKCLLDSIEQIERATSLFALEVDRLKLLQTIITISKGSHTPIKNLENYIFGLNHHELLPIYTSLTRPNLVEQLYLHQCTIDTTFQALQQCIVEHGKIKFEKLSFSSTPVCWKLLLSDMFFFIYNLPHGHTPFQGQLDEAQLSRHKKEIIEEYQKYSGATKETLQNAGYVFTSIIVVSLAYVIMSFEDKDDILKLQTIASHFPLYNELTTIEKLQASYELSNQLKQGDQITRMLSAMAVLKNYQTKAEEYRSRRRLPYTGLIEETVSLVSQLSQLTRRRLYNRILQTRFIVFEKQYKTDNDIKRGHLDKTMQLLSAIFIDKFNLVVSQQLVEMLVDSTQKLSITIERLRNIICKQFLHDFDRKLELEEEIKTEIVLFDQLRGYEVPAVSELQGKQQQVKIKRNLKKNKKAAMTCALWVPEQETERFLSKLQSRIRLQVMSETMTIRKEMYLLQLQNRKMRKDISWEICKLQNIMINKINSFIAESHADQQQSLINFKYTVNLETKKGIQYVIKERTEMYEKASREWEERKQLQQKDTTIKYVAIMEADDENSILSQNVKKLFKQLKTLKIFVAWRGLLVKCDESATEWNKFVSNMTTILHDSTNLQTLHSISTLRQQNYHQSIIKSIISEENANLNNDIKEIKINKLSKKLQAFRAKNDILKGIGVQRQSIGTDK